MSVYAASNPSPPTAPLSPQFFPRDAHAVIYRPARSAMTSGRARTRNWKLRFERRSPPFIEPLMGWTGGDDTLIQVELSFPNLDSAESYARRQGLTYTVQGTTRGKSDFRATPSGTEVKCAAAAARRRRLEWVERTLGADRVREGFGPGVNPAESYTDPTAVLRDESLTREQKREMLQRWAVDAYQLDLAFAKGTPELSSSRLQEVIDALIELDRPPLADARSQEGDAYRTAA